MYDQYYEEMMRRMRVPQAPQTPGNPMPPLKGAGNMPTTAALPYPDTGPMNPPPMMPPMEGPSMPQLPPQGSPKAAAIRGAPLEEIQVQGQRVTPSSGMVAGMEGQQGMPQGPTPEMIAKMSQGIEAEQAGIDRQRKVADQMRGRRAPQGREVGPIGVYMGPNWGESLGYAAEQIGAGLVDRSASKKDAGLQKKRDEIRTAEAEYAESLRKQGLEREDAEIAREAERWKAEFDQDKTYQTAMLKMKADEAEATAAYRERQQALEQEKLTAKTAEERAKVEAKQLAEAKKEVADVKEGSETRMNNLEKASKLLKAFNSGAESGTTRKVAGVIPGVYTDQGNFDEELNSFAEVAARAALKDAGETRPTDADVAGMKESMFGIGRDEQTNINLLQEYIQNGVDQENKWREVYGEDPYAPPSAEKVEGDDWYQQIFVEKTEAPAGGMSYEDKEKERRYQEWLKTQNR